MPRPRKAKNPESETLIDRLGRRIAVPFDPEVAKAELTAVSAERVGALAVSMANYMRDNLPKALAGRDQLGSYRINPYVTLASAGVLELYETAEFSQFLVHSKFYAGLETSFGKSIEEAVMNLYPALVEWPKWVGPPEKVAEFASYGNLTPEERNRARNSSVWREIDKSWTGGGRRYFLSIKSGPDTINDTQVEGMRSAIKTRHEEWLRQSLAADSSLDGIDVVIGLTYGTNKRTNNKENQILIKLLGDGFEEEDTTNLPGVLVDPSGKVRVYRVIGRNYWSFVGNPTNPSMVPGIHFEVLLALVKAIGQVSGGPNAGAAQAADEGEQVEDSTSVADDVMETVPEEDSGTAPSIAVSVRGNIKALADSIQRVELNRDVWPEWVLEEFSEAQLRWVAAGLTSFYD